MLPFLLAVNPIMQIHFVKTFSYTIALSLCLTLPVITKNVIWAQTSTSNSTSSSNLTHLIEQLKSSNENQRIQAIEALSKGGNQAIPALRKALKNNNQQIRSGAAFALGKMGKVASTTIPDLANLLQDSDETVRANAVFALGKMGKLAKPVVPKLAEVLNDKNPSIRVSVVRLFENLGSDAYAAVPSLIKTLQDSDATVVYNTIEALVRINPIPELITATKSQNPKIRIYAIGALRNSRKPEVIRVIAEGLKDKDKNVRTSATFTLKAVGKSAKSVVPELIIALKDPEEMVRQGAVEALGEIGSIKGMVIALQDPNENVQSTAVQILANLASRSQKQANQLSKSELNETISLLQKALNTLEKMQNKSYKNEILVIKQSIQTLKTIIN